MLTRQSSCVPPLAGAEATDLGSGALPVAVHDTVNKSVGFERSRIMRHEVHSGGVVGRLPCPSGIPCFELLGIGDNARSGLPSEVVHGQPISLDPTTLGGAFRRTRCSDPCSGSRATVVVRLLSTASQLRSCIATNSEKRNGIGSSGCSNRRCSSCPALGFQGDCAQGASKLVPAPAGTTAASAPPHTSAPLTILGGVVSS